MSDFLQERWNKGMEILTQMGRQETMLNQKEVYPDLYDLSVGYLFGEIWSRPHLNIRDRQLVTLAAAVALAHPTGVGTPAHCRSALHLGFTKEQIMEIIIHVGMYAGWPAMIHAFSQFAEVLKEDEAKAKDK